MNTDKHELNFYEFYYDIESWGTMASAYKGASVLILENLAKKSDHIEETIFPALFLLRHYIELSLKECLEICKITQNLNHPELNYDRNLNQLFQQLSVRLNDFSINSSLDTVKSWVDKFSNLDKASFAFRYPSDKRAQKKHPFPTLEYLKITTINDLIIDLNKLDDAFETLSMSCRGKCDYEKEKLKLKR